MEYKIETCLEMDDQGKLTGRVEVYGRNRCDELALLLTADVSMTRTNLEINNFDYISKRFRIVDDNGRDTRVWRALKSHLNSYFHGRMHRTGSFVWV